MGGTGCGGIYVLLWWAELCPPPRLVVSLRQTMVGVLAVMDSSFKRTCARTVVLNATDPFLGHCRPTPLLDTPGHWQASLAQYLVGSFLLSPGFWCTQGFVCALQESVSPFLCKSPCPCGRPLLTRTSEGDIQTLKGKFSSVSVGPPGAHKVLSEPSKHLWQVWGLILGQGTSSSHQVAKV